MSTKNQISISIIIRFFNESEYLETVFKAIKEQDIQFPVQIVSVNNNSNDGSIDIANSYSDLLLDINEYEPGKALNKAIEKSNGSIIVVLSAHAIPGDRSWLKKLISPFIYNEIQKEPMATYGAQIYPFYSKFLDKRDLDIFNFAKNRFEYDNSDFWNANSAFRRSTWIKYKFDEQVYELEDHLWTKNILLNEQGYFYFNSEAYVYHYGHVERIDRKYPFIPEKNSLLIIEKAKRLLQSSEKWSDIMWAGLMINSIPGEYFSNDIINLLGNHLINHWDFDVRWRIAQTLGNIPGRLSISFLTKALSDESFYPRNEAAWALVKQLPISVKDVRHVFEASNGETKLYAAFVLALSQIEPINSMAINYLLSLLRSQKDKNILNSLYILGELGNTKYATKIINAILCTIKNKTISSKTLSIAFWSIGNLYENNNFEFPLIGIMEELQKTNDFLVTYEIIISLGQYLKKNENNTVIKLLMDLFRVEKDLRIQHTYCQVFRVLSNKITEFIDISQLQINSEGHWGLQYELSLLKKNNIGKVSWNILE